MDLNTITVSDFKTQFKRGFPYLPVYSSTTTYNVGDRVYYAATGLFYDCKLNGTINIIPTTTMNWTQVADSTENYVLDDDITRAFAEAKIAFNQALFGTDDEIKLGFLYMAAHYLCNDLKAARSGVFGSVAFPVNSRSVGNVSESYSVPDAYLKDPILSFYTQSAYGLKFLAMALPKMRGNFGVVFGATLP